MKNKNTSERVRFCTDRPLEPNVGAGSGKGLFCTRLLPVFYPHFTRVPACGWPMFTLWLAAWCYGLRINTNPAWPQAGYELEAFTCPGI